MKIATIVQDTTAEKTGKLVIAQIHGYPTGTETIVKIQFQPDGLVRAIYDEGPNMNTNESVTLFSGANIGDKLFFNLRATSEGLRIISKLNGVKKSTTWLRIGSELDSSRLKAQNYFKAGTYNQTFEGSNNDVSRVNIAALSRYHSVNN